MSFLKKLFETRPLSLPELLELHASDGMYKGEILNELKNKILFMAFPETPSGPVDLSDPTLKFLYLTSPDNRGLVVPVFTDQVSLQKRNDKLVPHMIDFKSLAKLLANPYCLGILFCCGPHDIFYNRNESLKVLPQPGK